MRSIFALAPAALAALFSGGRVRRTAGLLHQLSDTQLKDIGLARCDIERVARSRAEAPFR